MQNLMKCVCTIKLKIQKSRILYDTMKEYSKAVSYIADRGMVGKRSKGYFVCNHCGNSLNSDLNASFNLAKHHSMSDDVLGAVTHPYIQGNDAKGTCATAAELMDKSPQL